MSVSTPSGVPGPFASRHLPQAALLLIGAELAFALMGASIRLLSQELPNATLVFFRNFIALLLLLAIPLRHGFGYLRTQIPLLHLLRGLAGLVAMYCFFFSIAHLPLAEAMLLNMSAPLFIPLVAWLWLGETLPWRGRGALLVGFTGVTLILHPDLQQLSWVALVGLLGGLCAALVKVTLRRLGHSEPIPRTLFYFALIGSLGALPALLWDWQTPSPSTWPWLGLVGLLATLGQWLLTRGLALAPVSRTGIFGYFSVLFGAALGWLCWDEVLGWHSLIGCLLVILAGGLVSLLPATLGAGPRPRPLAWPAPGAQEAPKTLADPGV